MAKTHKTHFTQKKEMPWRRPITISMVNDEKIRCGYFGCQDQARYVAEGKAYCTFHWVKAEE